MFWLILFCIILGYLVHQKNKFDKFLNKETKVKPVLTESNTTENIVLFDKDKK